MSTQAPPKRMMIRWTTLKGATALFLFLIIATVIECIFVLYTQSRVVKDGTLLQWSFRFPGTGWDVTLAISPLFHLAPIAVIIALTSTWMYVTRHVAVKPHEIQKGRFLPHGKGRKEQPTKLFGKIRSVLSKAKGVEYLKRKILFARATIRGTLVVLIVFLLFIAVISLLAYPQLIFRTIADTYQGNPSLLNFIRGTGATLAPIGSVFSSANSALLAVAPGFRDFALGLGGAIGPLASLDETGKYLFLQNAAAWISALVALLHVEYGRKGYHYTK